MAREHPHGKYSGAFYHVMARGDLLMTMIAARFSRRWARSARGDASATLPALCENSLLCQKMNPDPDRPSQAESWSIAVVRWLAA